MAYRLFEKRVYSKPNKVNTLRGSPQNLSYWKYVELYVWLFAICHQPIYTNCEGQIATTHNCVRQCVFNHRNFLDWFINGLAAACFSPKIRLYPPKSWSSLLTQMCRFDVTACAKARRQFYNTHPCWYLVLRKCGRLGAFSIHVAKNWQNIEWRKRHPI